MANVAPGLGEEARGPSLEQHHLLSSVQPSERHFFFLEVLLEGPGSGLDSRPTLELYVASGSSFNLSEFGLLHEVGCHLDELPG